MAATEAETDDKDQAILEFIRSQPGAFAGTAEVAEEVGMTTNGASYRLKNLRQQGKIDSRIVSRDEVWYPTTHSDGYGAPGLPLATLAPNAKNHAIGLGLLAVIFATIGLLYYPVAIIPAVFAAAGAGFFTLGWYLTRGMGDPSFEQGDLRRAFQAAKEYSSRTLQNAREKDSER